MRAALSARTEAFAYFLHFMKWPFESRQTLGLVGHLTNLPLASLHGAAKDGADPARRLNADNASTSFFMTSSLQLGASEDALGSPTGQYP